jgi:hypothetical protein
MSSGVPTVSDGLAGQISKCIHLQTRQTLGGVSRLRHNRPRRMEPRAAKGGEAHTARTLGDVPPVHHFYLFFIIF